MLINPNKLIIDGTINKRNLTVSDVLEKCNLKPFESFDFNGRRSGRTTKMLCDAVISASKGHKVFIEGHTVFYGADLDEKVKGMAIKCNVDPSLIRSIPNRACIKRMDEYFSCDYYVDHYVQAQL